MSTLLLHTPVCDTLGCRYPLVLAGMGGVARSELVSAVSHAGGFGFLGMVREPVDLIRAEIERVRAQGVSRFGVNLIPAATDSALLDAQLAICIELHVPVVSLFWDLVPDVIERLRSAGILVVCQIGSAVDAQAAEQAGAQILIAQGVEAGGHVRGLKPRDTLLSEVVECTYIPVLSSGGIVDGSDVASVLALGAQGAVLGTAFIATPEAFAHDFHKQRLVAAGADDTVLTEAFHINWPRGARVRVLGNSVTRAERGDPQSVERVVIGDEEGRPIFLFSTDSPLRSMRGDFEAMALYAGQGVSRVQAIVPAAQRLQALVTELAELLDSGAPHFTLAAEVASPPCLMHTAEAGGYLGFARRDEILAVLDELLAAERAGARVAMCTAAELGPGPRRELVLDIQRDEARWCAVLTRAIRLHQGEPTRATGEFMSKALAIADLDARLRFLNRGQAWVVRQLETLLPRVRDEAMQGELAAMLASHRLNIDRVDDCLHTS